jgi:hypothetical protein
MTSWLARTFRGRRLDHNPLRRPSDRAETIAGVLLVVGFAVAAPFTVHAAAARTYTFTQHARATAIATRHEVTAVTLEPALSLTSAQSWVSARWTAPGGRQRTGQVKVGDGTPKGSTTRIWVTGTGDMAPPPLAASECSRLADYAAAGAGLGLAVMFLIAGTALRHVLNRRRMAAWDAGWAAAEPRWSHRQRW